MTTRWRPSHLRTPNDWPPSLAPSNSHACTPLPSHLYLKLGPAAYGIKIRSSPGLVYRQQDKTSTHKGHRSWLDTLTVIERTTPVMYTSTGRNGDTVCAIHILIFFISMQSQHKHVNYLLNIYFLPIERYFLNLVLLKRLHAHSYTRTCQCHFDCVYSFKKPQFRTSFIWQTRNLQTIQKKLFHLSSAIQ